MKYITVRFVECALLATPLERLLLFAKVGDRQDCQTVGV
jgi:hypothetical protein